MDKRHLGKYVKMDPEKGCNITPELVDLIYDRDDLLKEAKTLKEENEKEKAEAKEKEAEQIIEKIEAIGFEIYDIKGGVFVRYKE